MRRGVGVVLGVLLGLVVVVRLGVLLGLVVVVRLGVLLRLGVRVMLIVRVILGVLVLLGVRVVLAVRLGVVLVLLAVTVGLALGVALSSTVIAIFVAGCGDSVGVGGTPVGVSTGCVGVDTVTAASTVAVAYCIVATIAVDVLLGVGVTDALTFSCPIEAETLMMVVLPSGIRAMLSPAFNAPKSIRSI